MTPRRSRAARENINRQFVEVFILPNIWRAVSAAGLRGRPALSAALGEIENCRLLWHIFDGAKGRGGRRGRA